MIGKKDSNCIFEQYRGIIKEQSDDLLTQVKKSALDPKVKQQLIKLLSDPVVAKKWKGGDADTVNRPDSNFGKEMSMAKYGAPEQDTANAPDPNFARKMEASRKAQEDAYPESEVKKFLGEEEEEDEYADPASFFQGPTTPISQMGAMKFPEKPIAAPKPANLPPKDPSMYRKDVTAHHKPATETIPNKIAGFFSGGEKSRISSSGGSHTKAKDPNWAHSSSEWEKAFAKGASGR